VDDDGGVAEAVREWLEQGGYVLEMRVARALVERGLSVDQGYHYQDPVTHKEREGDLTAMMSVEINDDHWHMLDLTIECKSSGSPWIGFIGSSGGNGPWTASHYMDPHCDLCMSMLEGSAELRRHAMNVYALTEKRSGTSKDHAYEALQQVVSSVLGRYKSEGFDGHPDSDIISILAVPIVVTTSPLFACHLDEAGDVAVQQVDRLTVSVPRMQLPDSESEGVEVTVVHADALDALLSDLEQLTMSTEDE
jgi:hypothetical protein